jgi:glycosyltransferase involved in cell wall biosynthesis
MQVSVIIPVYNAERFIEQAVYSVLNQTFRDFELLIIDDGSTDQSAEIIKQINDPRILFFQKANEGQCKTLNYGLEKASGDFIKFLDADDYLNANHLEKMMEMVLMVDKHEADMTLILSRWQRFKNDNDLFSLINRPEWVDSRPLEFLVRALGNGPDMLPGWQWLIPRALLQHAGNWNEELGLGNDFEFSVRLILASKQIKICPEAMVYYRSDLAHNMSSDMSINTIMSVLKASRAGVSHILKRDSSKELQRVCADKLQVWLLSYYPYISKSLAREVEQEVKMLGGSDVNADWGSKLLLLKRVFGWKAAKMFQHYYYKLRH